MHVASMVACFAKLNLMCTMHTPNKSLCKVHTSLVEVHDCDVSMRQMACRAISAHDTLADTSLHHTGGYNGMT